jgi:methylated-DNA-protein-cysteine methyltransferase-like protein
MSGKSFFDRVYDIVARIPEGKVMTYGQIAMLLGNPYAAKIVGYAMSSAPQSRNLPCHRVVNKTGKMAPGNIFGGADMQHQMLEKEGIQFKKTGCIDMELCAIQWEELIK